MDTKKQDLIKLLQENFHKFSKGQKLIADYIIKHYEKAAFLNAAKLGEAAGVSESTVVRFAVQIGFDGYPNLQSSLQEMIRSKLTSIQRIEVSTKRIGNDSILKNVLQSDMEKIKITLEQIDQSNFDDIVENVLGANRIYILGVRSSASLAAFLGFYFNLIFDNVRLIHTASASEMFEQILNTETGDVVIGISFPRYSRRTIKAMEYAGKQGATVIAITDSKSSPLAACANNSIIARSDMASFADSLVAPLSVINALIAAVGMRKKEEIYKKFEKLEELWDEYQVYEKYHDDITPNHI